MKPSNCSLALKIGTFRMFSETSLNWNILVWPLQTFRRPEIRSEVLNVSYLPYTVGA